MGLRHSGKALSPLPSLVLPAPYVCLSHCYCSGFLSLFTPGLHHNHQANLTLQLPPPSRSSVAHYCAALTSAGWTCYYKRASVLPCPNKDSPPFLWVFSQYSTSGTQSPHTATWSAPPQLSSFTSQHSRLALDFSRAASVSSLQSPCSLHPQASAQAVPSAWHAFLSDSPTPFS